MIEFVQVALAAEASEHVVEAAAASPDVIGMLGINWKLFVAQLINFGIVVFVLWKWVFTPVTSALSARTKKIEDSLKHAREVETKVAQLEEYRKQQSRRAQEEYEAIIAKAEQIAVEQKAGILATARSQAEKMMADAEARMTSERDRLLAEVREDVATLVIDATERIVVQKLDATKDARLIRDSLKQIK